MSERGETIAAIAQDIERYLEAHPAAADTSDGIAKWWLKRQRMEEAVTDVSDALAWLLERGRIECSMRGATTLYRRACRHQPG